MAAAAAAHIVTASASASAPAVAAAVVQEAELPIEDPKAVPATRLPETLAGEAARRRALEVVARRRRPSGRPTRWVAGTVRRLQRQGYRNPL